MGQSISLPPSDLVIYISSFLCLEDLHSLELTAHLIRHVLLEERELWRSLLRNTLKNMYRTSFPEFVHVFGDIAHAKLLLQRLSNYPTRLDVHALRTNYGPKYVFVETEPPGKPECTAVFHKTNNLDRSIRRRSIVANCCFPCQKETGWFPKANIPFTKVSRLRDKSRMGWAYKAALSNVAYFECKIHQVTPADDYLDDTVFSVGLTCTSFSLGGKLPGEKGSSYGYESRHGYTLQSGKKISHAKVPYEEGDTVGCGIIYPLPTSLDDPPTGCILFTKNGNLVACVELISDNFFDLHWFPVMGIDSSNAAKISFNFGLTEPFLFDVDRLELNRLQQLDSFVEDDLQEYYFQSLVFAPPISVRKQTCNKIFEKSLFLRKGLQYKTFRSLNPSSHIERDSGSNSDRDTDDEEDDIYQD